MRADLWYASFTADFRGRWGHFNGQIGLFADQPEVPCTPVADLAYTTNLSDDLADLKLAALCAHLSQTRPLIEVAGIETYREWWRTESFRSARTATLRGARR